MTLENVHFSEARYIIHWPSVWYFNTLMLNFKSSLHVQFKLNINTIENTDSLSRKPHTGLPTYYESVPPQKWNTLFCMSVHMLNTAVFVHQQMQKVSVWFCLRQREKFQKGRWRRWKCATQNGLYVRWKHFFKANIKKVIYILLWRSEGRPWRIVRGHLSSLHQRFMSYVETWSHLRMTHQKMNPFTSMGRCKSMHLSLECYRCLPVAASCCFHRSRMSEYNPRHIKSRQLPPDELSHRNSGVGLIPVMETEFIPLQLLSRGVLKWFCLIVNVWLLWLELYGGSNMSSISWFSARGSGYLH